MTDKKRSSAIFINGGAGRVIASIPALEKFQEENPDDEFVIAVSYTHLRAHET